ncbi:uncharacterized protein KY384_008229 [Bacidia gigantensis]|uniref:uncharacterized protein n=1 Tax=Bacidia gigantensis TaxID=2732470 RepID=UPI001D054DB8|nr:uncharacterized protein KY384_008229 [Bacidia gigantensis]KAG8526800.1 hypothetical protein KY384_008229 [Bacidia gigantensis]
MPRQSSDPKRRNKENTGSYEAAQSAQLRAQEMSRTEELSSSGGEGRMSRRLRKQAPSSTPAARPPEPTPLAATRPNPTASTAASRRRQSSIKLPAAPNTLQASPSKRYMDSQVTREQPLSDAKLAYDNSSKTRGPSGPRSFALNGGSTHSRQTSLNNGSRYSIASATPRATGEARPPSGSFDFLPSVNFDDLHSSLFSDIPDIDAFPAPGGSTFKHLDPINTVPTTTQRPTMRNQSKTIDPAAIGTKYGVGGGPTSRQTSNAQYNSIGQSNADSTSNSVSSASGQSRRKSHFPSTTMATTPAGTPRKSVGPGILTTGLDMHGSPRRPSLAQAGLGLTGTTANPNDGVLMSSQPANFESSRYEKAKSFQAVTRKSHDTPSTPNGMSPNMDVFAGMHTQSPGRPNGHGTITPSSNKRMSVLPNSAHATGLAARTISPTDARRLKRMSMMPGPPPIPFTPPTPQPDTPSSAGMPSAPSPSLVPRKSVTPSSSRTTPDINRKSYSSGFSISSSTSYNSNNAPAASTRMSQNLSISRLPTLKSRVENLTLGDEETVPPVPAIPKAFESPKEEIPHPFATLRKSSLTGGSTTSGSTLMQEEAVGKPTQSAFQHRAYSHAEPATERKPSNNVANRRTLQPLRLPPLNLLPLSAPTANKIAALYDGSNSKEPGAVTPPPKEGPRAVLATPMTASKASFSRTPYDERSKPIPIQPRSNSSHHAVRSDLPFRASSSSSTTVPNRPDSNAAYAGRAAMSPFVSCSLPKSSGEFTNIRRETSNPADVARDVKSSKPNGPRLQKQRKASRDDEHNTGTPSPADRSTPSFGTTLRRKLSLTRKRSTSKAQATADSDVEMPPKPPKHDDMPPPRLPASATWSGPFATTPSPSQKTRSRNASNSSTVVHHERNRSSTWDSGETPKKTAKSSTSAAIPSAKRTARSILEGASNGAGSSLKDFLREAKTTDNGLDRDDMSAEEEMRKLASKRKETENAAKELDALIRRATAKERVSPTRAKQMVKLNIFERGEIVDAGNVYFCGTQNAKKHIGDPTETGTNFGYDDDRGDYNIVSGDHLAYRYEIVDILGKGSFGQVVRCIDHKTGGLVAIKIIRNKKRFHQQALVEVDILQKLREWDPYNKHCMVNFTQSFYFRNHLCISTELLGMNLYEFIKCHDFRGFSLKLIRRFAKQLLSSLVLLKSKRVIHCDLKPENVLLTHPARSEVKVIDFGSSCHENEKVYTYIQSRFYRSPEVILGMSYGMPIDMWSLGCILAELLTGYPIFPGENEQEQLSCIMEVFGPPEKHLIEKSTRKKLFFDSLGKPRITVSSKGKRRRPSSKSLQQALKCEDEAFLDFITRCLRWDPDRRLRPDEALHHEFIAGRSAKSAANRPRTAPATAVASPIKRYNSISQTPSASIRPLPEPPNTIARNANIAKSNSSTSSPVKRTPSHKRNSTINTVQPTTSAPLSAATGTKRPYGAAVAAGSALPRVTSNQRVGNPMATGGGTGNKRTDLASAAAVASLAQKSR